MVFANVSRAIACTFCALHVIVAAAGSANAVEYYNASLEHYFVTAEPDEAAALDAGTTPGWTRTGFAFSVATDATGGDFPFHALYLDAPGPYTFAHYWSSEGAFWQQADVVFAEEQWLYDLVGRSTFPVTLALARGAIPTGTNSAVVRALYDKIASREYAGLRPLDLP
jgi:hypothetical protein